MCGTGAAKCCWRRVGAAVARVARKTSNTLKKKRASENFMALESLFWGILLMGIGELNSDYPVGFDRMNIGKGPNLYRVFRPH